MLTSETSKKALEQYELDHLDRIRSATLNSFTLAKLPEWIESRTTLEGAPFSFKNHEYQLQILRDESREIVVKKCSQVGITELAIRRTLGILDILPDIHCIYTLPTSKFAGQVVKTRFNPVIENSQYLRSRANREIDSAEMKQIGSSYLYIKGTIGTAAAISVPASLLVHDEVDFSDQEVLSNYQSRMTHSRYKMKFKLSTPTIENYGIDGDFKRSRRFYNFCKCHHCGHHFLPDYFSHVKVPDYTGDLREITKENLHNVRYQEAQLLCPRCGKEPDLSPENRQWVLENPNEAHVAAGYQISPFDAPAIITPGYLVEASTKYKRYVDFVNFGLGQTAEDKDNALTAKEVEDLFIPGEAPTFASYVIGVDLGLTMHIVIAGVTSDGVMYVVHLERVSLGMFHERFADLISKFYISNGVFDSQPYTDLVMNVQSKHHKIYGAVYIRSKSTELFTVTDRDEDLDNSKLPIKLVNINRNKAFDMVMAEMRNKKIVFSLAKTLKEKDTLVRHVTDMKRMQKFDQDNELVFNWEKSADGNDHYHHALLYCWVAAQMRGFGGVQTPMGPLVRTFKNKTM